MATDIGKEALSEFLRVAGELSESEYNVSLKNLLDELSTERGRLRYGRLLGVMVKSPMAERRRRDQPSERTGALYDWAWDPDKLTGSSTQASWQHKVLVQLSGGADLKKYIEYEGALESRIFVHLMRSVHDHVCGGPDTEVKRQLRKAVEDARKKGYKITNPVDFGLAVSGAGVISGGLTAVLGPWGIALGPLVGGIALLLLSIGLDAFCLWSAEQVWAIRSIEENEQLNVQRTKPASRAL